MSVLGIATPHDVALAKTMVSVVVSGVLGEFNEIGDNETPDRRTREILIDYGSIEACACGLMECEDDNGGLVYQFDEQDNSIVENIIEAVCAEFRASLRTSMRECMTKFIG